MDTCSGDLNGDALTDYLLVLRLIGEDSLARATESSDTFIKRRLLILTGQSGQTYKLAAQSDNVIDCVDCGGELGEPYQGLVIKNGYFSVKHYGGSAWRWTRFVTFKYATADSAWYLHKDGKGSFNFGEPDEKGTIKIRTIKDFGKVAFADFDIYRNWFE